MGKRFHYGGQAVIEGVMMRGRNLVAIAVRRPSGDIVVKQEPLGTLFAGRIRGIPLLRGPLVLVETFALGIRALLYSASVSVEEEQELTPKMLWGVVAFGVILALGLFLVIPLLIIHFLIDPHVSSPMVGNVADGIIRLVIFLIYLKAMNFMPDIRRVFAYHGAEHKTINAYEAGEDLEIDRVRPYGTAHSRCGTSFILFVMVIAIIAHAFLGRPPMWLRFLERLALLPLIGAISYEMIKFGADHTKNKLVSIALMPGLALQRMTTREPDDDMLEVAISALRPVLAADSELSTEITEETASVPGMTGGTDGIHL